MALPLLRNVTPDGVLTEVSIRFKNPLYIADECFPVVESATQSGKIRTYPKEYWFRDEAQLRSPGEAAARSEYRVLQTTEYHCDNFALAKDIPDELRKGTGAGMDLDVEAADFVTDKILLRREKNFVSEFFVSGVWGTDYTPTNKWDDWSTSEPIKEVGEARATILKNTGVVPNTLILGYEVYNTLRDHPAFTDRIKYTQTGVVTADLIGRVLDIDRILVAQSIWETAAEGAPSEMAFAFGKNALLLYVEPAPSLLRPSAGYTIVYKPFGGAGFQVITTRRDDRRKTDVVEGFTWFDQKLLAKECGYFFSAVVS